MTNVYLIDENAIWIDTLVVDLDAGRPANSVLEAPPTFDPKSHFAAWSGVTWLIRAIKDLPRHPASTVSSEEIDTEHDRRVLAGRAFAVDGIGDVPLEGSEKTQLVLLALKDTARDLKDAGITAPALVFTDRDGTDRRMTAGQMIALVNAGKAWVQSVHEAKRALKAMDPIPADFADDRRWPS